MKTRFTLDSRRAFIALGGLVLLIIVALTGVSALIIWDSNSRLQLLHTQAEMLADAQDQLLNLLVIEQNWLDLRTGVGGEATENEVGRRDALLQGMDSLVQKVSSTLQSLSSSQGDYVRMSEVTALGVALLVIVLAVLALVGRERVLKPMWGLADLLGRLAREDYQPAPLDNVDEVVRPAFESYNRLVSRLSRLERAHQARHHRLEREVREAARALLAQRVELARVERLAAVGEVAATLAHEVRNPLAAIRAACQSLILDVDDEDARERLRMIDEEVERLAGIVEQQLTRTRHRPEEANRTEIPRLVRKLVNLMKYQMPESVTLRTELPRNLVAHLPPNGLRQALVNLVRNAQDSLEQQGGVITVAVEEQENGIEIRVEDTGSGFPEEVLASNAPRRFVTSKKNGTGLGLAMVSRYVRDQGGSLKLENRPEGGARVRMILPRKAQADGRAA